MSGFNLDDYVDVAERVRLFYERYPDGRLLTVEHGKYEIGGQEFVYCMASAYREPNDVKPCKGIAWEPFPGKTPYTRDSELMNAETAAWGRAIIAAGIPSKKIASAEEVRNRASSESPSGVQSQTSGNGGSGESRRTIPQNLAELDNLFAALAVADPSTDWKESASNMSARLFGERDPKQLKAAELDSVVKEVGRWLATATPAPDGVPF